VYPEAAVIEYHFDSFDPRFAGADWESLRVVLEPTASGWFVVGIVHDSQGI
jgi:hypothetical protein